MSSVFYPNLKTGHHQTGGLFLKIPAPCYLFTQYYLRIIGIGIQKVHSRSESRVMDECILQTEIVEVEKKTGRWNSNLSAIYLISVFL